MSETKDELQALKLEALKRELSIGIEQIKNGEYADYDDDALPAFLENIKTRGRKNLGQNSSI